VTNAEADAIIDALIRDGRNDSSFTNVTVAPMFDTVLSLPPQSMRSLLLRVIQRRTQARDELIATYNANQTAHAAANTWYKAERLCTGLLNMLLLRPLPLSAQDLASATRAVADSREPFTAPIASLLKALERHGPCSDSEVELRREIEVLAGKLDPYIRLFLTARRLRTLISVDTPLPIEPGEAWTDAAIRDIDAMPARDARAWNDLLCHCLAASGASPNAKWLRSGAALVEAVGADVLATHLTTWFPLVDAPRTHQRVPSTQYEPDFTHLLLPAHAEILKGLCWLAPTTPSPDLARALARLTLSAYRKLPGTGPRAVKVGNAAVYALGQTPGPDALGQLAMLRVKVKFRSAQKIIEKALTAAAARAGLPRDEIDELAVPSYGLTDIGLRRETIGDYTAELRITGLNTTELTFFKIAADAPAAATPGGPKPANSAKGSSAAKPPKPAKPQKSVPAALKASHADELKDLKSAAKDIAAMLPAQRDRIDSLFLDNKSWPLPVWRERYLDHPLIGTLARRLIWRSGDHSFTHLDGHLDSQLVDAAGKPTPSLPDSATITLWHPINATQSQVLAWRRFFEDRKIRQPFKQAHREVYLLTDAERTTATYSNRFAAHILRQHQFHALCGVRNWKNKLRLMVDAEYPPAIRQLPAHNLRAEFWIEGVGDNFGTDTNEAGAFLYLTTDQVRFYRPDAALPRGHAFGGGYGAEWGRGQVLPGVPLSEIPPLVLSEILRDTDLFVGVASIGNNPQWNDGGPAGTHRNYWWEFSFGDLSETGHGRMDFLARLLPRLAIADRCSLDGKFLRVKGTLRTYKIHLGSGNILMDPDDQYLCIVPGRRAETTGDALFLPFEGDRTLSIILSKAFMLAADDTITDPSILRQIRHR